jgi:hypothetical protein
MSTNATSLTGVVQLAVPPAFAIAFALRWLYLRAVRRSMLRPATGAAAPGDEASSPQRRISAIAPPAQRLEIVSAATPAPGSFRAVWRGPCIAVAVHVAAGLIYGLVVTLMWVWLLDSGYSWEGILLFTLFHSWPLVIVVALVATVSWRAVALVVLIYAAMFLLAVAGLTRGTGITLSQAAHMWWSINGIGTVLVLAFLARPIQAMGPIVLALMMAATAGVLGMADLMSDQDVLEWVGLVATNLGFSGNAGGIAAGLMVFAVAALAAGLIAYIVLRGVGLLYQAQWISDQSIRIDAVWLVFAVMHAPVQYPLAVLAAFLVYKLVAVLGQRLVRPRDSADDPPPRLLLLRVFSLGRRSEYLFRAFSLLWRYVGSVRMIAGPDLANATVEPHEFLDFLAGRLQRRFITDSAVLEQRLAETLLRRDPDGRFRVSSFFCHADTWQTVLRRLTRESDLVLMDLRGFTPANEGCVYELNELLNVVRLEQCLLVVDDTTDQGFLSSALQQGWASVSADSPNRSDATPRVRLYPLDGAGARGIDKLVTTLASVHARMLSPCTR